jgi:hypothetical protein
MMLSASGKALLLAYFLSLVATGLGHAADFGVGFDLTLDYG